MNNKFFIHKYSVLDKDNIDLSFVPMMVRRRFSQLAKISFSTMNKCFENDGEELFFASQYGEFDILRKIIEQYSTSDDVSPTLFSNSVHNSMIGTFSILNKITFSYNSVSAGDETISNSIIQAVCLNKNVLYCYSDTFESEKSFSCLIGHQKRKNSICVEVVFENNSVVEDEYNCFTAFLSGKSDSFNSSYYTLRRVND